MPLIKSLATNDTVGLKLMLRTNFYAKATTPEELGILVFKQGTTFPEISKEVGTKRTVYIVFCLIQNFCNQYNLGAGKNMNFQQVIDLATDITTGFIDRKGNAVRLEEMAIFFDKAGKGEYKRKNGQPFIFDRIDRQVIEEMLERYFETDRTAAVWALEDAQNNAWKERQAPEPDPLARMIADDDAPTVGDLYTRLAGKPGAISLQKLKEKYLGNGTTGNNDAGAVPGEDITAGK